jgi:hypothetical protein
MKKTVLLLMLFCGLYANAQNTNVGFASIVNSLDSLRKTLPVEKVHLHLDKPFYSIGDTIWIKAYVVDQDNRLSDLSRVVHLDLINSSDSIKTSLAMPLNNGEAWGGLTLTDTIFSAGNYNLRAYTNVMRNFDSDYFYNRSIAIGNALPPPINSPVKTETTAANTSVTEISKNGSGDISLAFFPEGGNLINGVPSIVAFKAVGTDGLSRDVNGYIVDQKNERIATFASEHAGMGVFKILPTVDNTYNAIITVNGAEKRIPLPPVQNIGYGLAVTQDKENIIIKIISSASITTDTLNIVAQANNEVFYTGQAFINGRRFLAALPKKRFPEGVLQITLFDKKFIPAAERLTFIKHNSQNIHIGFTNTPPVAQNNGKVQLNITAKDAAGKPVQGAFSVAVTNADKVHYDENSEASIYSDLLLTADLKGYIEQPNYYFTDTLAIKQKHLDNLLLTQGWRRFVWQDVFADKMRPVLFKPERDNVTGLVVDSKKQPVAGARVSLFLKTGGMVLLNAISDVHGKFSFDSVLTDKNEKYSLTATDRTGKTKYTVELDKPEEFSVPLVLHRPLLPYTGLNTYLESAQRDYIELTNSGLLNGGKLLKEAVIKQTKKPTATQAAVTHSKNLHGPGNANDVITFLDLVRCNGALNLGGCLLTLGKLINISNYNGVLYSRGNSSPMAIYVDGVYMGSEYDGALNDISSVEILKSVALSQIYGQPGFGGVILITTKTGDIDYNSYEMERYGVVKAVPKIIKPALSNLTLAPRREFYVPNYTVKATQQANFRSTIYRKPNIVTDEKGRATVEFYTGEAPADYRVILEGISINGQPARQVFTFKTK